MVEMIETARIMHNATERSLVILDEVGRGTSTHDGISIAWAIAEQLARKIKARTLFATHYHELVALADEIPQQVHNLNVEVKEWKDEIVFLHHIVPGSADKSYGIHVARLAGIPTAVLNRSRQILDQLETATAVATERRTPEDSKQPSDLVVQQELFGPLEESLKRCIADVDPDQLTPRDAQDLIYKMCEMLRPPRTPR